MKNTLLYLLLAFFPAAIFAQRISSVNFHRCYTYEKMQALRALDPVGYDINKANQDQALQNWIAKKYQPDAKVIYTIPVVVQIFGATPNSAVTDNRVYEQIAVLNQDYRRLNTDTGQTPADFKSIAADCEIEFCLATIDPSGNATTGIVRKTGSNSPTSSDLWNTAQYLNLLVYSIGGGTLGFTYLPSQAPNNGVHIGYQYFGKTGATSPFNKGRTASHEIGHWFNLEHIWADESSCGADDGVSDTPKQKAENYGCPSYPQTTQSGGRCNTTDPSSMFMNYMDYTDDGCMNIFTAGQKARMIAAINQYRSGLLNNGKCGASTNPPTAAFTANQTTILAGSCVNFTDQSTGVPTSWAWTFQGGTPSTSNQESPANICFNVEGCYNVTLIVSNTNGSDTLTQSCYINVIPPSAQVCDTVSNYKLTDTPSLIGSGGWGYVTGHNDYDDRAKADYFTAPPAGLNITGAKFWFGKTFAGNTNSSIDVRIWNDNGGSPGAVFYSQTVPVSQLQLYPLETFITFTSPQTLTGNYFLGIQISPNGTPQDTIALMSNNDGETNPGTAWELWSDGVWHAMSETPDSWGINIAQAIWAVRCPADTGNACSINVSTSLTNPACGQNNGSITATATGGAAPYTYLWNNGQASATATGLASGNYSLIVTDANSCSDTVSVSLSSAGAPTTSAVITNVSCNGGNDGSVVVTVSGGTTPYTFNWNNGATTSTISSLTAGNYSGTVTDANGCQSGGVANVTEPTAISGSVSTMEASCGNNNGSATVTASGGTPGYAYSWSNGQTGATATGLAAGNYSVSVTDVNNCSSIVVASVSNTNAPVVIAGSTDASSFSACDGAASANATGGTPPYTYLWSNGSTTASITGLCSGTYNVTVTDGASCAGTASVVVSQPVGINGPLDYDSDVQIFPNPNNGKFSVVMYNESLPVSINVYNVLGEKIKTERRDKVSGGKMVIDLTNEDTGIYFVEISTSENAFVKKVSLIK